VVSRDVVSSGEADITLVGARWHPPRVGDARRKQPPQAERAAHSMSAEIGAVGVSAVARAVVQAIAEILFQAPSKLRRRQRQRL